MTDVPVASGAKASFSPPFITEDDIDAVVSVLRSGWITTGPVCQQFEHELATSAEAGDCLLVNSGTAALETALRALDLEPGDEVIVPAYTYTASAASALHAGATIRLVDSAADSVFPDTASILDAVNSHTKAVVTVDLGGVPAERGELMEALAARSDFTPNNELQEAIGRVAVIDDGAHSLGATVQGRGLATTADFTAASFHAVKNLTTAEGGALMWRPDLDVDHQAFKAFVRCSVLHGQTKDALAKSGVGNWEYDILFPGHKQNMPDILATLGLSQWRRYQSILDRRREIVELYDAALSQEGWGRLEHFYPDKTSSYHLYMAFLPDGDVDVRNDLITRMGEEGFATNVHYKPLPLLSAYKHLGFQESDFPHACSWYQREITLPVHLHLSDEDVTDLAHTLNALYHNGGRSRARSSVS